MVVIMQGTHLLVINLRQNVLKASQRSQTSEKIMDYSGIFPISITGMIESYTPGWSPDETTFIEFFLFGIIENSTIYVGEGVRSASKFP